jgi:hypothetical protein
VQTGLSRKFSNAVTENIKKRLSNKKLWQQNMSFKCYQQRGKRDSQTRFMVNLLPSTPLVASKMPETMLPKNFRSRTSNSFWKNGIFLTLYSAKWLVHLSHIMPLCDLSPTILCFYASFLSMTFQQQSHHWTVWLSTNYVPQCISLLTGYLFLAQPTHTTWH